jgi:hypothetical protein
VITWRQPFQIGKKVGDLLRLKLEFRHVRMSDHDALSECLLQIVNMPFAAIARNGGAARCGLRPVSPMA